MSAKIKTKTIDGKMGADIRDTLYAHLGCLLLGQLVCLVAETESVAQNMAPRMVRLECGCGYGKRG